MPRWTEEELEAYYLRRNNEQLAKQRNVKACGESSSAEPEQAVCARADGKVPGKKGNPRRCRVSVTSFRRREIDPDNLCVKSFVDALRYAGVLQDDTAKHIELIVRQEKADSDYTEITVEQL